MQFKSVKNLMFPLIKGGHEWQYISINGEAKKPRLYFSGIQWILLLISSLVLFKLVNGISTDVIGYVISAFSISVSLFMSLLVSIFDKFENTDFETAKKTEAEIGRLKQKKNFFKRFISVTSYLVVLSILIIILCSLSYIFDIPSKTIKYESFTYRIEEIDIMLTAKNIIVVTYRTTLNYFLLNYLLLTFFITGSAYEYYISEINSKKIVY